MAGSNRRLMFAPGLIVVPVLAIAMGAALLSTIVAARTLAGQEQFQLSRLVAPGTGRVVASDATAVLAVSGKTSVALRQLRQAVAREPLDPIAVATLGQAEDAAGNRQRAAALMSAALQIDPRNTAARGWQLQDDVRQGRYDRAVYQLDRLMLLLPNGWQQSLAGLAALAQLPQTKPAFDRVLAARPNWRPNLFETLNRTGASGDVVRRYLKFIDAAELPYALDILLRDGDIATARALRTRLLGSGFSARSVIDPRMTGRSGVAPFAWSKNAVASGSISFSDNGAAIFVSPGPLVEATTQRLLLTPGQYQLEVNAGLTNAVDQQSSLSSRVAIELRVKCDDGPVLATIRIDGPPSVRRVAFTLGEADACFSQYLSVLADPSASLTPVEATLQSVDIVRQ